MKISCEVIRDLLPLYHDGVCSNDTKKIVEEHLAICSDCREELQLISGEVILEKEPERRNEEESIKKISKEWKKSMFKSLIEGIIFTLLTVIILMLIAYVFMGIRIG